MKAIYQLKKYLLVLFSIICFQHTYASHSMGGYISYRCVDTVIGRYEITLNLFRDCSGIGFGIEQIQIISSTLNTTLPMTKISDKEVTPLCQVPDVDVRATTNCPQSPITNIKGVEKHTFRAFVTLGKNKGWAIVGWGTCCRLNRISNIQSPGGQTYWIQAAINTNYINSSPIVNSEATNYLWQNKENWIDFSARDSFDPKYIIVDGRFIVRDSLVYEFYTPNTAQAANANAAIQLENPSVVFNQGLSAIQFIPSNPPIGLNKNAGIAKVRPTILSDAVAAVVVKEFRAIPTSNGKSYTRQYIGYTCRDQVFITGNSGTEINNEGVIADSSNVEFIVNPNLVRTCRAKGNKIVMRFSTTTSTALKIKDVSVINNQEISNYSFKTTSKQIGNQTVAHVEFKFDRNFATLGYEFKVKVYYCNANGVSVENYIPLSVLFSNATIGFETDTLIFCTNSGTVPLSLPLAKKVNWKSNDAIVSVSNSDSNFVTIFPQNSHWIYATNLKHSELCRVNDSIYVKVETCNQVKGNIYHDVNNNCSNDASIDLPAKIPINLKGKTSSYNQTIYPDNSGNYSFSPPSLNDYILTVSNVIVNCNSKVNVFDVYLADSPTLVNIAVKDSPSFIGYPATPKTLNYCVGETTNAEFVLPFVKSMGYIKARMEYGNGVFDERILGMEPMQSHLVFNRTYNANGVFPASIKILSYDDKIIYQTPMNTISIGSCLHAKFNIDMNDDCILNTGDLPMIGSNIELKNLTTNQKENNTTNSDGTVSYYVKNGVQYNLSNVNVIGCNQSQSDININMPSSDTIIQVSVPLDKSKLIPIVTASLVNLSELSKICVNEAQRFRLNVTKTIGSAEISIKCNDGNTYIKILPFMDGNYSYIYSHIFNNLTIGQIYGEIKYANNNIVRFGGPDFYHFLCPSVKVYNDVNSNCSDDNEGLLKYKKFKLLNLNDQTSAYYFSNNGYLNLKLIEDQPYELESNNAPICNGSNKINFFSSKIAISNLKVPTIHLNNYIATLSLPNNAMNNTSEFTITIGAIPSFGNIYNPNEDSIFNYELNLPPKCFYKSISNQISPIHIGNNVYRISCHKGIKPKITVEFRDLIAADEPCFMVRLIGIYREADTSDNIVRRCRRAFTSYDPNNKIPAIRSSINTEDFIDKTNPITYTINFQNEGKAPARDVYILDQLSSKLNWESIEIKHASHPMSVSLSNSGQLRFDFKDIILPEKAVNEEGSKGHVIFSIKPNTDLEIGDVIRNTAEIYFDANDAVITNTAISRLVKPTGPYYFFNVNISTYPQNAGVTSGQGRYIFDDQVKAEAIPQPGYKFNYWTDNGVVVGPNTNYFFISNKDRYLTAHFTKSTSQVIDANVTYKIAPNPASDFVYIEFEKPVSKFSVSITSLDGRKVAEYFDQIKIPVENLPRGTYFIELKSEDIIKVEKLILK